MITSADSNVLIDVFGRDPVFWDASSEALRRCLQEGVVVACDVVWAEVIGLFPTPEVGVNGMEGLGIAFSEVDRSVAVAAGQAWRSYRHAGGPRDRIVADFLVGAHARLRADRLLTRDRGFYRKHFEGLDILDPSRG